MPKNQTKVRVYPEITETQAVKDSLVFATIMAGVKARRGKLKPLEQSLPAMETFRATCAVGAGLQGANKTRVSDIVTKTYLKKHGDTSKVKHQLVPLIRFAMAMEISEDYACGINDGFEDSKSASRSFYPEVDTTSLDYERGWHVGQAVAIESASEKVRVR